MNKNDQPDPKQDLPGPNDAPTQPFAAEEPDGSSPHPPAGPPTPSPWFQMPTQERPVLSNAISLGAVGIMALIASVGILFAFNGIGVPTSNAGRVVLVSVGLIVALAGTVLVYAALKGSRPGWFLPFTIIGAILGVPIVLGGGAMTTYGAGSTWEEGSYEDSSSEADGSYFGTGETSGDAWTGDTDEVSISVIDARDSEVIVTATEDRSEITGDQLTVLDPELSEISGADETLVLDLTEVREGVDQRFYVELSDAFLVVALTEDQLPLIDRWEVGPNGLITADNAATGQDEYSGDQLAEWVTTGFDRFAYPDGLGRFSGDPDNTFHFDLALEGESTVWFVVVDEDLTINGGSQAAGSSAPQSDAQSDSQSGR